VLSSTTKKGEIERTSRLVWVLVINDNDLKGLMPMNENAFRSKRLHEKGLDG